MTSSKSPFTRKQLLPQEEMLAIERERSVLHIGIPKESSLQEKRVCLTPDAVGALVAQGHKILVEEGAGVYSGFSDIDYSEVGAEITTDRKRIFGCPLILKVEPPTLDELDLIAPGTVLISALQLEARKKQYFELLEKKKITALAFEFIRDTDESYPAVRMLSEVAGIGSIHIAAELMSESEDYSGILFGNISGVPPTEVVVIGAGTVGMFATRSALGLGANVKLFDNSITKLRNLQAQLKQPIYTSTLQPKNLLKALMRCDVAIGAVRGKNRSPILVTETMVENMKPGSVIVDVSIDMGGCFETSEMTSHENPYFIKHGVVHYCVPNIPARYPKTASVAISNIITPYLLEIAEAGSIEQAIRSKYGLRSGVYCYKGIPTNKSVASWFDMSYSDINIILF
ncbi:MAG TPA: alanine dehydrogenase [Flavobacteriaceae bacterium]|nr:alanine dehydrogenase [Flavobacteriaceae bacterium]